MLIGVNLSQNPFKTSFPASGWKCCSLRASQEAEPRIGIPSQRLGTRQSLKAGSRLTFTLS